MFLVFQGLAANTFVPDCSFPLTVPNNVYLFEFSEYTFITEHRSSVRNKETDKKATRIHEMYSHSLSRSLQRQHFPDCLSIVHFQLYMSCCTCTCRAVHFPDCLSPLEECLFLSKPLGDLCHKVGFVEMFSRLFIILQYYLSGIHKSIVSRHV